MVVLLAAATVTIRMICKIGIAPFPEMAHRWLGLGDHLAAKTYISSDRIAHGFGRTDE